MMGILMAAILISGVGASTGARAEVTLTDVTGRQITLDQPARRLLITDGRFLVALSLIHPDPVSLLAAWPHDIDHIGPDTYTQLRATSPAIASLPKVAGSARVQSVEQILAVRPDLAVFPLGSSLSDEQRASIEAAGIPVLVLDFFTYPLKNVDRSLRLLGHATGSTARAERFIAFRRERMRVIAERVAHLPEEARPAVFLEPHAGLSEDCCASPGNGRIGEYIDFVGGDNIGRDAIPSPAGWLSLEYVITRAPEVYIATGGPHMERRGGLVLGSGFSDSQARASLAHLVSRPGFADLPAVLNGRAHGLSHQLLNSPLDIMALEYLAKSIHPTVFRDINPDETRAFISELSAVTSMDGVFWTRLVEPGSR
ncbi:ABC transporter substrate-binding protein [Roseospira visakhapatnamensis]|uniref:Iron complex transport system substrate-binding protein n=1 Tax=Roseospira visakhapatnamensis TaxID=390880 RepID=A0A7W6WBE9_9PROT|nr:ABC transporter substrate-binding protein [Roseospira visakhapatnamensis]MBB4267768.1 iron complex transport system substrate-binding protein [Roseospira visakhapatnamensis]